ncbi:MAG: putative Transposon Ty3-I Gag-Pol polyprotein, partial [Streblomastix strix]
MLKIDLESAFYHIIVDKDFRPYLGFTHQNRYYQYRAMCFGVKHAPLTFHKTLLPVIRIIREELGVRILAYCDDIIIIHEDKGKLIEAKDSIINILMNFGWKIAMNKSVLEPTRVITFLGWQIDMNKDQLMMTEERQARMKGLIGRWRRIIQQGRMVKVKFLASFLGSLNFLRLQIRRGGLHMRKLNKIKSQIAMYKGWNSYLHLHHNTLQEIFWWKSQIDKNKPIQATISQPEATLTTDASLHSWGACLKLMNPVEEVWFQGSWSSRWNLNSSNQREAAAILCALRRSEPYFKERQTKSLKIETDNSSAAFNINRGAAATALAKLVDRTLETADNYNLQLHAYHIPGTQNKIPDSLSRLATSGDYMINQQ